MGALAVLESKLLRVEPGASTTAQVRVRNTGSVVDQFTFQVLGDSQPWASVAPASLSLFPGAEESASVTFSPPRSALVPAGQMPFGIRVISKEDPQGSVVEEGVLDVAAFSDVFAELAPRTSRGSRGAKHDLAIDNRGNAPLNATLSAVDPDRLLAFDLNPPGILADPGTAAFATVAVKPLRRFWRGPSQTRPFQVLLEGYAPAPLSVDGTMVQEAILPPWFMRAVLAVLALLLLLVLLWFFLLKPAIESTAEQRTEDILTAAGIPIPSPGSPGGGGGTPTATPTLAPGVTAPPTLEPGVTASPAAPPLSGGGAAKDGRIAVGDAPLTVEAGKTLFITDLVFSNPSSTAVGELRLERSGQPLLVLRLENFRDLDFHFVTPIVAAAGQQIGLACTATDPSQCQGVAVYYSGYQR